MMGCSIKEKLEGKATVQKYRIVQPEGNRHFFFPSHPRCIILLTDWLILFHLALENSLVDDIIKIVGI